LSATATHDTKRGEDARARLAVLSELPEEWKEKVHEWRRLLRDAGALDSPLAPNDEYYFYQTLLGAWPAEFCGQRQLDEAAIGAFAERLRGAMQKAVREAKLHSTWASPNESYEQCVNALIGAALDPSSEFLASFGAFATRVAELGVRNSLVQLVLKLTAPGVPDIYQGCETWDLSLVDPDNRRRIDFAAREAELSAVRRSLEGDRERAFAQWLRSWHDGRIKLAVLHTLLELRGREPALFGGGGYEPCEATGGRADELISYVRRGDRRIVLTAAQRFPVRAARSRGWDGTRIHVANAAGRVVDVLTGRGFEGGDLDPAHVFATLPVAVLVASNSDGAPRP
jgi:(1->4)-alpha-D-glucan 1-alpha-D-glucosylmutase